MMVMSDRLKWRELLGLYYFFGGLGVVGRSE